MFNIKKSLEKSNFYLNDFPGFSLLVLQSILAISVFEIFRQQLPEIKLIQLVPGAYFFFIFLFALALFFIVYFFIFFPFFFDQQKNLGTKNIFRIRYSIYSKFLYFFYFFTLVSALNFILPVEFDNFYSYTEKNFENIWSFDELINLESILLLTLLIISKIPLGTIYILNNEVKIFQLPKSFRALLFFTFFLSGLLTPTVDLISQITFAFFSLLFYLISIHFLLKRINVKLLNFSNLD